MMRLISWPKVVNQKIKKKIKINICVGCEHWNTTIFCYMIQHHLCDLVCIRIIIIIKYSQEEKNGEIFFVCLFCFWFVWILILGFFFGVATTNHMKKKTWKRKRKICLRLRLFSTNCQIDWLSSYFLIEMIASFFFLNKNTYILWLIIDTILLLLFVGEIFISIFFPIYLSFSW